VYGAGGQLGQEVVKVFRAGGWTVGAVSGRTLPDAHYTIQLQRARPEEDLAHALHCIQQRAAKSVGGPERPLGAVVCVAGGWEGGTVADADVLASVDAMYHKNVRTSVMASHIAARCLHPAGLLVLTGAAGVLRPTPAMLGYGMAKMSVLQLVSSLAHPSSGVAADTLALLPGILDTPSNRAAMPDADHDSWTPLAEVCVLVVCCIKGVGCMGRCVISLCYLCSFDTHYSLLSALSALSALLCGSLCAGGSEATKVGRR
jgi:dihydropteridine reductase